MDVNFRFCVIQYKFNGIAICTRLRDAFEQKQNKKNLIVFFIGIGNGTFFSRLHNFSKTDKTKKKNILEKRMKQSNKRWTKAWNKMERKGALC